MFGAIEAGGTKFICGAGTGPDDLELIRIPTTSPAATMAAVMEFFQRQRGLKAVGIGSFGPIDRASGRITNTPKRAWQNFDIAGSVRSGLSVPVSLDTDVNASALAESRWGAGRGLTDFVYLTVGTGIGGGAMVNGLLLHGAAHPEMGHLAMPRDAARDPFAGCCPYHGDCLEGLASGPALEARWGAPAESLPPDHPAWTLEAHYLALGLANIALMLAPQRILLGGGVMRQGILFDLVRRDFSARLNGYVAACPIAPPELGPRAGVLGGLILAEQAEG